MRLSVVHQRLIFLSVLLLLTIYILDQRINEPEVNLPQIHANIVAIDSPTNDAPMRYRVLIPFAVEALATHLPGEYAATVFYIYAILDVLLSLAFIIGLYRLFKRLYTPNLSLLGASLAAFSFVVIMQPYDMFAFSLLEALLFVWGIIWLHSWYTDKRDDLAIFVVLTIAASLNRATGVFLPLMFLCVTRKKALAKSALLFAVWFACYAGVRALIGPGPRWSVFSIARFNFAVIADNLISLTAALGAFWVFAYQELKSRSTPPFMQALKPVLPVYLALFLLFGVWRETRLLLSAYPLIFGLGLNYLSQHSEAQITNYQIVSQTSEQRLQRIPVTQRVPKKERNPNRFTN